MDGERNVNSLKLKANILSRLFRDEDSSPGVSWILLEVGQIISQVLVTLTESFGPETTSLGGVIIDSF